MDLNDFNDYYLINLVYKLLYSQTNVNYLKCMWKRIKMLIFLKELASLASSTIIYNGQSLTKSPKIANAFNKYLVSVASDIQSSIKCFKNNFHDLLPPLDVNYFFSALLMKLK